MVEEKKKAVLHASEYLFSTKGFNETTVADISKESGIHEASIYSYFNNKKNILFIIQGNYLKKAISDLNEHFQGMKEPGPKLRKAIWHYLSDMENHPYYARTLMMAQRENPDFYNSDYVKYVKAYSKLILEITIAGQEEGLFRPDISPRLIRNIAMGTSVYTAFDGIIHEQTYDPNEMSDVVYQLLFNATGAEVERGDKNGKIHRSERTELRRSQIIETALHVFSRKGYSNATISEVAKQANLGDATLYEYFDNKEAILLDTAETYLKNLVLDDDIFTQDLAESEGALRKLIWRWIWQIYTDQDFSRLLILELFRNINFYSSPGYNYIKAFQTKIESLIRQGQEEGVFIKDVPFPTFFHMIIGTLDQFLLGQFLLNSPPLGIAELNDIVEAFIRAIKVRRDG